MSEPAQQGERIRVLIVMRDRMAREALVQALTGRPRVQICGNTSCFEAGALHSLLENARPTVLLLDVDAQTHLGLSCLHALSHLHHTARILMTGLPDDDKVILAAIESGAAGIATQRTGLDEVVDNIYAVADGNTLCPPRIASLLFSRVSNGNDKGNPGDTRNLTPREMEIVALVENGLTNKAIARELNIGVQTVKNHVHNILEKLDMRRRTDVARYARRVGWVVPGTGTDNSTRRTATKG